MRAVVQRVAEASVSADGEDVGRIEGPGLLILLGVTHGDDFEAAERLAGKIYALRIFDPDRLRDTDICIPPGSPREVSASDLGLPVLVISQFTLYGDARKGRRPTWDAAAPGSIAEPLVDAFAAALRQRGAYVATGRFGAHMRVASVNDGPVTLILDS